MGHRPLRVGLVTSDLLGEFQFLFYRMLLDVVQLNHATLRVFITGRPPSQGPSAHIDDSLYRCIGPSTVDGVIVLTAPGAKLGPGTAQQSLRQALSHVALVSVGLDMPPLPAMTIDNRAGMRAAVEHLIRTHQCRRIAYLSGSRNEPETLPRLEGYRYALEADYLTYNEHLVRHDCLDVEQGRRAAEDLLLSGRRFDAIAASHASLAKGALLALRDAGIPVPQRMKVVTFNDGPSAVANDLTAVSLPLPQLALRAYQALNRLVGGESARSVSFVPKLTCRGSCGCGHGEAPATLEVRCAADEVAERVRAQREALVTTVRESTPWYQPWWMSRAPRVVDALIDELDGKPQSLSGVLSDLCERAIADGLPLDHLGQALLALQHRLKLLGHDGRGHAAVEQLWSRTFAEFSRLLSGAHEQAQSAERARVLGLSQLWGGVWSCHDESNLGQLLALHLPEMGIRTAVLSTQAKGLAGDGAGELRPILRLQGGTRVAPRSDEAYPMRQLLPAQLDVPPDAPLFISTLDTNNGPLGVWACDGHAHPAVFEQLRAGLALAVAWLQQHERRLDSARSSSAAAPPNSSDDWNCDTIVASPPPPSEGPTRARGRDP